MAALLLELCPHGPAKGDFERVRRGVLGSSAPLSPASIERLRVKWQVDDDAWAQRSLADRARVYAWANGVSVKPGLEREKAGLLVGIGAMSDGTKEVRAVTSGYRESKESWRGLSADREPWGFGTPWRVRMLGLATPAAKGASKRPRSSVRGAHAALHSKKK